MKNLLLKFAIILISFFLIPSAFAELNTKNLTAEDIQRVENLLAKLAPLIEQGNQKGMLPSLTFEELYAPLSGEEKEFLKHFQELDAKKLGVHIPFRGIATGKEELVRITDQSVKGSDGDMIPPQYLPYKVYIQYSTMMQTMENDLGKRLYVESGYRSSAYQLYLFIFYLKNHDYSIEETVKWVALPGYSEHGSPKHQAIDFINEDGVSGETDPKAFEDLIEYEWLLENAYRFNFVLSYPKDTPGVTFEPWHWRYESSPPEKSEKDRVKEEIKAKKQKSR